MTANGNPGDTDLTSSCIVRNDVTPGNFLPISIPDMAIFNSFYDQFRIAAVKMRWIPDIAMIGSQQTANWCPGPGYLVYDSDGIEQQLNNILPAQILDQTNGVKTFDITKPKKYFIKFKTANRGNPNYWWGSAPPAGVNRAGCWHQTATSITDRTLYSNPRLLHIMFYTQGTYTAQRYFDGSATQEQPVPQSGFLLGQWQFTFYAQFKDRK